MKYAQIIWKKRRPTSIGLIKITNYLVQESEKTVRTTYTKAAKRLYEHYEINHELLFSLVSNVKGDFLITYDDTEEIEQLAARFNLDMERVLMKTTLHYKKYELVIGRNLNWLREYMNNCL